MPASVKNYLLKEEFEVKYKAEDPAAEAHIIFILDTSGSMASGRQMSYVKGVMEQTVKNQRFKKAKYALIMLEGEEARITQAFTSNHLLISQETFRLRTRGKTNLGAAFTKVHELCRSLDKRSLKLFIFTDGKANSGSGDQNPFDYALKCYRKYIGPGIKSSVIDTEKGMVRLGKAKELAERLGLKYTLINT